MILRSTIQIGILNKENAPGIISVCQFLHITVPTHNSDISQNSDTLFALTEMSLFWEEEDSAKRNLNIDLKNPIFYNF